MNNLVEINSADLDLVGGGDACTQNLGNYAMGVAIVVGSFATGGALAAGMIALGAYTAMAAIEPASQTCS